jgi:hypothetical protein
MGRQTGTVKWFNDAKGFGFNTTEGGLGCVRPLQRDSGPGLQLSAGRRAGGVRCDRRSEGTAGRERHDR